jgi:hypothetical protein
MSTSLLRRLSPGASPPPLSIPRPAELNLPVRADAFDLPCISVRRSKASSAKHPSWERINLASYSELSPDQQRQIESIVDAIGKALVSSRAGIIAGEPSALNQLEATLRSSGFALEKVTT